MSLLSYPPLRELDHAARPWLQWYNMLHVRVGGNNAPSITELAAQQYLVAAASTILTGERVATNTATITWDFATASQAKAEVPDDAITFAKLQNIATARLLGRTTSGTGNVEELSIGTGLAFGTLTLNTRIRTASIPFLDGDTLRRTTISDGDVSASSVILGTVIRPSVEDVDDPGYLYAWNIVKRTSGSFDVLIAVQDWGHGDPIGHPPNETITFAYQVA